MDKWKIVAHPPWLSATSNRFHATEIFHSGATRLSQGPRAAVQTYRSSPLLIGRTSHLDKSSLDLPAPGSSTLIPVNWNVCAR